MEKWFDLVQKWHILVSGGGLFLHILCLFEDSGSYLTWAVSA